RRCSRRPSSPRMNGAAAASPSRTRARYASSPPTLTNTRAWNRSAVTSTCVMIAPSTRGSFTSRCSRSEISLRSCSPTRAVRRLAIVHYPSLPRHPAGPPAPRHRPGQASATPMKERRPTPDRPPGSSIERPVTVDDPGTRLRRDQTVDSREDRVRLPTVAGHHTRGQLRALPQVLVPRLRHRHVEAVAQTRLQTVHDRPLLLQRLAPDDLQVPTDDADDHPSTSAVRPRPVRIRRPSRRPAYGPRLRPGSTRSRRRP